jgi:hypothetical protein
MEETTTDFFQNLYTADASAQPDIITQTWQQKIDEHANATLCAEYTEEEISFALFQIGPQKAPGPDGFPACFYQRNWGTLKDDIIRAVKTFFDSGIMPDGVNDTTIVLIPKIKNPTSLKDYRPIGLCNVIYKVVSKCLVNRLRPLLHDIISPTQSAFIPGRMITDNAIIAFECIHALQNGSKSAGQFCAYKVDLMKAYDRVDWRFLEVAMRRLGFCEKWICWIMTCVKTVRFSVRFNGKLLKSFKPSRGLRQGDPLSPYLFLLVGEGLSTLIQNQVNTGDLEELKICRRCPGITHLLFADDSLLFFKGTAEQAGKINDILRAYEKSTGQQLSPAKCCLMLGQGCTQEDGDAVASILGVESKSFDEK